MAIITILAAIPACALAARVHGGGPAVAREWLRKRFPNVERYLGGDTLSPVLFGLVCLLFMPWYWAMGGAIGWAVGWAPDIGDRVQELRLGQWKMALQRGVFLGAWVAVGTYNPLFILSGAMFPLLYWLSTKTKTGSWGISEWLQGAAIGLVFLSYSL